MAGVAAVKTKGPMLADRGTMVFNIALPVLGQQEFLSTALRSIAAQRASYELAVLDATPDDSVQSMLKEFRSIITHVRHGVDQGQAAAIQEGWERLSGNILYWLNADDYLFPHSLEAVGRVFAARPDVDVVYGNAVFVDRTGSFTGYFPAISPKISHIVKSCCIAQPACFVRRDAVEKIGGLNSALNYVMDWDLWARLFIAGAKFLYIKQPLAVIRMHEQTKTASGSSMRLREIQRHLRLHGKIARLFVVTIALVADAARSNSPLWQKALRVVIECYRRGKMWSARRAPRNGARELYGIDIFGNRVRSRAEVWLPWYGENMPSRIIVEGEGFQSLKIEVNGMNLREITIRDGTSGKKKIESRIPNEVDRNSLCIIKLSDDSGKPWELTSVRID